MIRLLGILTGSALAVAMLLLFIGIPQFESDAVQAERTPVRLPRPTQPVERADPAPDPAPRSVPPSQPERITGAAPETDETVPGAGPPSTVASAAAEANDEAADDDSIAANAQAARAPPGPEPDSWYAFWSPFKSRIAAEGFVARLSSVTGLDYRIVRREPGAWEVSFSYRDDDDIVRHLSQISAATGLDLPETP